MPKDTEKEKPSLEDVKNRIEALEQQFTDLASALLAVTKSVGTLVEALTPGCPQVANIKIGSK